MLISHEVPICLLEESKKFNDYDYCLLHRTYTNPEYKQFYLESIKQGRQVLLDNSLYELGDALTNDQLAEGVLELKPTWYVIPDCLNEYDITCDRFLQFIKEYPNLPGKRIGVIQGETVEELMDCYSLMSQFADKIAIPFGSKAFDNCKVGNTILEKRTFGRVQFIYNLIKEDRWRKDLPHHLLGCNLPIEFSYYSNISNIETIDTSNPIIAGILGKSFDAISKEKPTLKVDDVMEDSLQDNQIKQILTNVKEFRSVTQLCIEDII